MTCEQRFCPDLFCNEEIWMVRRDVTICNVWWVAVQEDDCGFVIAATHPVCPRCGMTLLTRDEVESRRDQPIGIEEGPMFDFVRGL